MNWERFWWNSVHGSCAFINSIIEHIESDTSVLITGIKKMSWRETMREVTKESLDNLGINEVRFLCPDKDFADVDEIGTYLVHNFTNMSGYRPSSVKWWDYIKRTKSTDSIVLWLYDLNTKQVLLWGEANRRLKGICSLVIETTGDQNVQGFSNVEPDVKTYDFLLLASQVASERRDLSDAWRWYVTDLAVEIYNDDAEKIVDFIETYDIMEPPEEYNESVTHKSIWKAQLKNVYHLIEEERNLLVERYYDEIKKCLPETYYYEEIVNPYDVELGLMWHFMDSKREYNGKVRLILNSNDYNHMYFLREVRNKLAHNNLLSPSEMEHILSLNNPSSC